MERAPLTTRGDLFRLAFTLAALPFAALTPARLSRALLAMVERLAIVARARAQRRRLDGPFRMLDGTDNAEPIDAVVRHRLRSRLEVGWGRVRNLRPRAWSPRVAFEGEDLLRELIARGRGVILWRMDFAESIVLHRGCWERGYPLVQLSDATHGADLSRLGVRVITPLVARSEGPYLARRIVIPLDRSLGYLRDVIEELEAGHLVVISGELTSRQTVEVSFFGRRRVFATGAPALAQRTGAALLPVATRRVGREDYVVTFGPEVQPDRSLPRAEFIDSAVEGFAQAVEAAVVRSPGDWNGWWFGYTSEPSP